MRRPSVDGTPTSPSETWTSSRILPSRSFHVMWVRRFRAGRHPSSSPATSKPTSPAMLGASDQTASATSSGSPDNVSVAGSNGCAKSLLVPQEQQAAITVNAGRHRIDQRFPAAARRRHRRNRVAIELARGDAVQEQHVPPVRNESLASDARSPAARDRASSIRSACRRRQVRETSRRQDAASRRSGCRVPRCRRVDRRPRAIDRGTLPPTSIRHRRPRAKKPSDRPSGDQNGPSAPSVPAIGRMSNVSRDRTKIRAAVPPPEPTNAIAAPVRRDRRCAFDQDIRRCGDRRRDARGGVRCRLWAPPRDQTSGRHRGDDNRCRDQRDHAIPCGRRRGRRSAAGFSGDCLQRKREVACGLESLACVLFQASPDQRVQRRRNPRRSAREIRGSVVRIAVIVSAVVAPWNARLPVSISYTTAPNAKISERWSAGRPRTCSGAM